MNDSIVPPRQSGSPQPKRVDGVEVAQRKPPTRLVDGGSAASTLGALAPPAGRTPAPLAPAAAPAAPAAAATAMAPLSAASLPHPIHEMHRLIERPYDRVMRIIGTVITAPLSFIRWFVSGALNVLKSIISFLFTLPLLIARLFGAKVDRAIQIVRQVIETPLALVNGLVEGALRAPETIVGGAFTFLKDLFSFRYISEPRQLIALFTQPVFAGIAAALSPLYYGLRNLDNTIFPPRPLSDAERAALAPNFELSTLDRVRIHEGGILRALTMWGDANTQDHDVYVDQPLDGSRGSMGTLSHELVHTLQVGDTTGGFPVFIAGYYAQVLAQLPGRESLISAYANTPQEVEAYELGG